MAAEAQAALVLGELAVSVLPSGGGGALSPSHSGDSFITRLWLVLLGIPMLLT